MTSSEKVQIVCGALASDDCTQNIDHFGGDDSGKPFPWEIVVGIATGMFLWSVLLIMTYGWAFMLAGAPIIFCAFFGYLIFLVRKYCVKRYGWRVSNVRHGTYWLASIFVLWPLCLFGPYLWIWIPLRVEAYFTPEFSGWNKQVDIMVFGYDSGRSCTVSVTGKNGIEECFQFYRNWLKKNGYEKYPSRYDERVIAEVYIQSIYRNMYGRSYFVTFIYPKTIREFDMQTQKMQNTHSAAEVRIQFQ